MSQPILLDCTLRDGGYYNAWDFSPELIDAYLRAMAALGTDYVEIGLRSFEREGFKGGCAYSTDSFVRRLGAPAGVKLGVMVNASELLTHQDGVMASVASLFAPASQSPIALVRIACHVHEVAEVLPASDWLRGQGYVVGVNIMQIADRSCEEIEAVAHLAAAHPPDVLYFADSMGGMDPAQTSAVVAALRRGWQGPLGIHTHDNMGHALANSMRALADGVTWIDGTVTGMGRGPGNAKTEYLALELATHRRTLSNIIPLLSVISTHFKPLQLKYGWGTNAFYYLAGKFGIHPSYIQRMLSDARYSDDDVIAVIDHLRQTGGKKYSVHTLESGRHFYTGEAVGSWAPAEMMRGRDVLVIGAGASAGRHKMALEEYIATSRPVVVALNTHSSVREELIDIRAASHPIRLLTDAAAHQALPQPLVTPASMLPASVKDSLGSKTILDFGLAIEPNTFRFSDTHCVTPTSIVIAYVLAMASSGRAARVLLAGFDGYDADDPRFIEMEELFTRYQDTPGVPALLSITPTRHKLPSTSVYSLNDER